MHSPLKVRREPYSTKLILTAFEGTDIIKLIVQGHLVQFYRESSFGRLSDRFVMMLRSDHSFQGGPLYFDLTDPRSLDKLSAAISMLHEDFLDSLRRQHGSYGEVIAIMAS